jgi:tetratricopeptide (TPR) repeat protein
MQGTNEENGPLDALRAELERLRQKRADTDDPDIVSALDLRIKQIEGELPDESTSTEVSVMEAEPEEEAPPAPPSPKEAEEAENLIRQARVEKMRNNAQASTDFLRRAADIAPGSPTVLEALGDDLAERKKMLEAKAAYAKARALNPKSVALERKYASVVLAIEMAGSLDDQMKRNLSDSAFLNTEDKVASLPVAIMCSAVWPGLGHVILGQTTKGASIMAAWFLCGLWLLSMFGEVAKLFAFAMGGTREQPNLVILLPLLIMAVIYVATLSTFKAASQNATRQAPDRPKPPVDLPFE